MWRFLWRLKERQGLWDSKEPVLRHVAWNLDLVICVHGTHLGPHGLTCGVPRAAWRSYQTLQVAAKVGRPSKQANNQAPKPTQAAAPVQVRLESIHVLAGRPACVKGSGSPYSSVCLPCIDKSRSCGEG